jgi:hypothetical protein
MADGLSAGNANAALGTITGSAVYVQLHTGAPGSAGTSNVSSTTTREAQTWGSASGGVISATGTPTWTNWAGTSPETDTDISMWSLATSGVFEFSTLLTVAVVMHTGDSLQLTSQSVTIPTAS